MPDPRASFGTGFSHMTNGNTSESRDRVSRAVRSKNMSRVRSKDTKPERLVRSALHQLGLRFQLHRSDLPGRPDITFVKHKAVIFVNGCFWHQHIGCRKAKLPSTRHEWWQQKLEANAVRDQKNYDLLRSQGWRVLITWECEINDNPEAISQALAREIREVRLGHG